MPAFFIIRDEIDGNRVTLTGDLHRHLTGSLRIAPGDDLLLTEEGVRRHRAQVVSVDRTRLVATIRETTTPEERIGPQLRLALAILKHDPMDWVVQKATELGVAAIQPLITERSTVRPEAHRAASQVARWLRIAREAAQQSERWTIPRVHEPTELRDWMRTHAGQSATFVLHERSSAPSLTTVEWNPSCMDVTLVIGPEGGWADREIEALQLHGCRCIGMGKSILRAETAALAAISLAQGRLGQL